MEILSYICVLNIKIMEGEVFHLVDREVLLERVKSLPYGSPERMFLLDIMDNTVRVHKPNHNYHIDCLIESCEQGNIVNSLQKCKI